MGLTLLYGHAIVRCLQSVLDWTNLGGQIHGKRKLWMGWRDQGSRNGFRTHRRDRGGRRDSRQQPAEGGLETAGSRERHQARHDEGRFRPAGDEELLHPRPERFLTHHRPTPATTFGSTRAWGSLHLEKN